MNKHFCVISHTHWDREWYRPLEQKCRLTYKLMLPENFDSDVNLRSANLKENAVDVYLTLRKDSRWIETEFDFDNRVEDHRLRALIKTGIVTDYTYSSAPFDVVKRDRKLTFGGLHNGDRPNSGFVDITDGDKSFAVLTEGVYEYKHCDKENGVLAFTLVRGIRGFGTYAFKGQQMLRHINLKIALMPHSGDYTAARLEVAQKQFQCPMIAACFPADSKKFTGGRPAVQDSEIKEIFFRKDKYEAVSAAKESRLFGISGEGVAVTAVKKSENGKGYIVRFYNASENDASAAIDFCGRAGKVYFANMEETEFDEIKDYSDGYRVKRRPKQIVTLFVTV